MSFGFTLLIIITALILFFLELFVLFREGTYITWTQTLLNLSLGFFDRLVGLYLTERTLVLFDATFQYRFFNLPEGILTGILCFILLDVIWYIFHRSSHRISVIWGIHLVHHQSDEFNLSVNFALSPMGFMLRSVMYSSLVLLGFPVEYVAVCGYLNAFYQYYLHTEFISTFPWLEKVFVMPNHHKVHHASNEAYLDKNYGGVFIVWDKLFDSYAPYEEKPRYGLTTPLPHKDFLNIQLFFFKKLWINFSKYGFRRGLSLLFLGPEHQDSDVPRFLPITTQMSVWKVVAGIIIYLVSYSYLMFIEDLSLMFVIVGLNFMAIILVNGLKLDFSSKTTRT